MEPEPVLWTILAKDKAHCLREYLHCLYQQTYPKRLIHLYVRSNNNRDDTVSILTEWLDLHGHLYGSVYCNYADVSERVEAYGQHEWNAERFSVLARLRQESVTYARERDLHYFVCDCDNFLHPQTLERLFASGLDVVAPYLTSSTWYSNFHFTADSNGYFGDKDWLMPLCDACEAGRKNPRSLWHRGPYYAICGREVRGLIVVDVVHCTYLVRGDCLHQVKYADGTPRHEYVIFSENWRQLGVPQYLDTRQVYGRITFAENREQLLREAWYDQLFHA